MYGLKQAALLAFNFLQKNLASFRYKPIPHKTGLWEHDTKPITFCLCIDDFGVNYFHKNDVNHLIQTLQKFYKVSMDWTGAHYYGLTINWKYADQYVDLNMPCYISNVLARFQHKPSKPTHTAYLITYSNSSVPYQNAVQKDLSPHLNTKDTKTIQQIIGCLLYYARALDNTLLVSLNTISQTQAKTNCHH